MKPTSQPDHDQKQPEMLRNRPKRKTSSVEARISDQRKEVNGALQFTDESPVANTLPSLAQLHADTQRFLIETNDIRNFRTLDRRKLMNMIGAAPKILSRENYPADQAKAMHHISLLVIEGDQKLKELYKSGEVTEREYQSTLFKVFKQALTCLIVIVSRNPNASNIVKNEGLSLVKLIP